MGSTLGPSGVVWPLGTPLLPSSSSSSYQSRPTLIFILTLLVGLVFRVKLGNLFSETLNCANISDDKVGPGKKENSKPRIPEFTQGRDDATIFQLIFPFSSDSRSECLAFWASFSFCLENNQAFCLRCQCYNHEKQNKLFPMTIQDWNKIFWCRPWLFAVITYAEIHPCLRFLYHYLHIFAMFKSTKRITSLGYF